MHSLHVQAPRYPGPPPPLSPQELYYQQYQAFPPYPTQVPQQQAQASGGVPAYVWVGVGVILAIIYNKVTSFFSNPAKMQEMAMKAMMSKMAPPGGAGAGAK